MFGREDDLARIGGFLRDASVRLVTLTGPGGVGKTRLAQEAIERNAQAFAGGAVVVAFSTQEEDIPLAQALANRLGIEQSGLTDVRDALAGYFGDRATLLLLDNLEHFGHEVLICGDLLRSNPNLTLLCTSRTRLQLSFEQVYPVSPLGLPSLDPGVDHQAIMGSDAMRLFVERAGSVDVRFSVTEQNASIIARLCHRLDGLPLALELAAAQVAILSPSAILARIEGGLPLTVAGPLDTPIRHRSLSSVVESTYAALSDDEQRLAGQLAVFVGGFTSGAVREICFTGDAQGDVLPRLTSLVERNLIVRGAPDNDQDGAADNRFAMLETIRAYLLAALTGSGALEETREAHARYYTRFAEHAEPPVIGAYRSTSASRVAREESNLRAALGWLCERGSPDALRLATAMGWFWATRGRFGEGRAWIDRSSSLAPEAPDHIRARRARVAGLLAFLQGDIDATVAHYEEARRLFRELGDAGRLADVLSATCALETARGAFARARDLGNEAIQTAAAVANPTLQSFVMATARSNLGMVAHGQGDLALALERLTDALGRFRALGNGWGVARSLALRAGVWRDLGELEPALSDCRECMDLSAADGDLRLVGASIAGAGSVLADTDAANAVILFGVAQSIAEQIGSPPAHYPLERQGLERGAERARSALTAEKFQKAREAGARLTVAAGIALAHELIDKFKGTPDRDDVPVLSPREIEVLNLVAQGYTDREIADALFISRRTAQNHVARIIARLAVPSRAAAAATAIRLGILHESANG